jgi:outer membrane protein assembly factor BamD (BamD/ComL family)
MKVVSRYPDTLYASKAQFKIASVYEKLGEPEIAAQEYVKLAYKYPESEYLATAMAKLGTHFLKKANRYDKEAESLLAKENDEDARFEGTARKTMAVKQFIKTADIFIRLLERFPEHELAGKVGVLAGQALLTAGKKEEALKTFKQVMGHDSYDGKQVRSKAMYWGAKCYCEMNEPLAAYSLFKRITYDFPESDWAAYARGELAEDSMVRLENDLEIERLEELNK